MSQVPSSSVPWTGSEISLLAVLGVFFIVGELVYPISNKRLDAFMGQLYTHAVAMRVDGIQGLEAVGDEEDVVDYLIKHGGQNMAEAVFEKLQDVISGELGDALDPKQDFGVKNRRVLERKVSLDAIRAFFDPVYRGDNVNPAAMDVKAATMYYLYCKRLSGDVLGAYTEEAEVEDLIFRVFGNGDDNA
jgi:hypothetical protein